LGDAGRDGDSDGEVSPRDEVFMRKALGEARKAFLKGEVPVGAVIVDTHNCVVAAAHNLVETTRDPTAHAELLCMKEAARKMGSWRLLGTTIYITLEPCPMCAGALLQSRMKRVVWGAPNVQLGADGSWVNLLRGKGSGVGDANSGCGCIETQGPHPYHPGLEVSRGIMEDECAAILREFFKGRRAE